MKQQHPPKSNTEKQLKQNLSSRKKHFIQTYNQQFDSIHRISFTGVVLIKSIFIYAEKKDNINYFQNIIMTKTKAFIFLLIVLLTHSLPSPIYQLSPALPPSAYVGQYYTCDFRIQGLSNPTFQFSNVPSFFKTSPSGRIQGTPSSKGTYLITLQYQQGNTIGQIQVVLSVANSTFPQNSVILQGPQNKIKSTPYQLKTQNKSTISSFQSIPTLFSVGDEISINLNHYFSIPARGWSYQYLPMDLTGLNNGIISGLFYVPGLYSFIAVASDSDGMTYTYIISINIQPPPAYGDQPLTVLKQVPVRDSCHCTYGQTQIEIELAKSKIQKAFKQVNNSKNIVAWIKTQIVNSNNLVTLAQTKVKLAQTNKTLWAENQQKLYKNSIIAKQNYTLANNNYSLALTNFTNFQKIKKQADIQLKIMQNSFKQSGDKLNKANNNFIVAQTESAAAASKVSGALLNLTSTKQDVNTTFTLLQSAKRTLQQMQNILTNTQFQTSNSQNAKEIANLQKNAAIANYNSEVNAVNTSATNLIIANNNVQDLQNQLNKAKDNLGIAKFNLIQAQNNLFVAQSIKEQSDKTIAIISAQSASVYSGNTTYIFSGCDQGVYPSFAGSAAVTQSVNNGVKLSTGHLLLYGNCSKTVNFKIGDIINFSGYIKNGIIQGLTVYK